MLPYTDPVAACAGRKFDPSAEGLSSTRHSTACREWTGSGLRKGAGRHVGLGSRNRGPTSQKLVFPASTCGHFSSATFALSCAFRPCSQHVHVNRSLSSQSPGPGGLRHSHHGGPLRLRGGPLGRRDTAPTKGVHMLWSLGFRNLGRFEALATMVEAVVLNSVRELKPAAR